MKRQSEESKSASKGGSRSTPAKRARAGGKLSMDPEERLRRVQAKIFNAMETIITRVIEEAERGKYTDARWLFELAGVTSIALPAGENKKPEPENLIEYFLERLEEQRLEQQPARK